MTGFSTCCYNFSKRNRPVPAEALQIRPGKESSGAASKPAPKKDRSTKSGAGIQMSWPDPSFTASRYESGPLSDRARTRRTGVSSDSSPINRRGERRVRRGRGQDIALFIAGGRNDLHSSRAESIDAQ